MSVLSVGLARQLGASDRAAVGVYNVGDIRLGGSAQSRLAVASGRVLADNELVLKNGVYTSGIAMSNSSVGLTMSDVSASAMSVSQVSSSGLEVHGGKSDVPSGQNFGTLLDARAPVRGAVPAHFYRTVAAGTLVDSLASASIPGTFSQAQVDGRLAFASAASASAQTAWAVLASSAHVHVRGWVRPSAGVTSANIANVGGFRLHWEATNLLATGPADASPVVIGTLDLETWNYVDVQWLRAVARVRTLSGDFSVTPGNFTSDLITMGGSAGAAPAWLSSVRIGVGSGLLHAAHVWAPGDLQLTDANARATLAAPDLSTRTELSRSGFWSAAGAAGTSPLPLGNFSLGLDFYTPTDPEAFFAQVASVGGLEVNYTLNALEIDSIPTGASSGLALVADPEQGYAAAGPAAVDASAFLRTSARDFALSFRIKRAGGAGPLGAFADVLHAGVVLVKYDPTSSTLRLSGGVDMDVPTAVVWEDGQWHQIQVSVAADFAVSVDQDAGLTAASATAYGAQTQTVVLYAGWLYSDVRIQQQAVVDLTAWRGPRGPLAAIEVGGRFAARLPGPLGTWHALHLSKSARWLDAGVDADFTRTPNDALASSGDLVIAGAFESATAVESPLMNSVRLYCGVALGRGVWTLESGEGAAVPEMGAVDVASTALTAAGASVGALLATKFDLGGAAGQGLSLGRRSALRVAGAEIAGQWASKLHRSGGSATSVSVPSLAWMTRPRYVYRVAQAGVLHSQGTVQASLEGFDTASVGGRAAVRQSGFVETSEDVGMPSRDLSISMFAYLETGFRAARLLDVGGAEIVAAETIASIDGLPIPTPQATVATIDGLHATSSVDVYSVPPPAAGSVVPATLSLWVRGVSSGTVVEFAGLRVSVQGGSLVVDAQTTRFTFGTAPLPPTGVWTSVQAVVSSYAGSGAQLWVGGTQYSSLDVSSASEASSTRLFIGTHEVADLRAFRSALDATALASLRTNPAADILAGVSMRLPSQQAARAVASLGATRDAWRALQIRIRPRQGTADVLVDGVPGAVLDIGAAFVLGSALGLGDTATWVSGIEIYTDALLSDGVFARLRATPTVRAFIRHDFWDEFRNYTAPPPPGTSYGVSRGRSYFTLPEGGGHVLDIPTMAEFTLAFWVRARARAPRVAMSAVSGNMAVEVSRDELAVVVRGRRFEMARASDDGGWSFAQVRFEPGAGALRARTAVGDPWQLFPLAADFTIGTGLALGGSVAMTDLVIAESSLDSESAFGAFADAATGGPVAPHTGEPRLRRDGGPAAMTGPLGLPALTVGSATLAMALGVLDVSTSIEARALTAVSIVNSSDARLKTDVRPAAAWDAMASLRPRRYAARRGSPCSGFVAQEVFGGGGAAAACASVPEAVGGFWRVDYRGIAALFAGAVAAPRARVEGNRVRFALPMPDVDYAVLLTPTDASPRRGVRLIARSREEFEMASDRAVAVDWMVFRGAACVASGSSEIAPGPDSVPGL